MNNTAVSVIVFILVALFLLCVVLIIASLSKAKLRIDDIPKCEKVDLLSSKERAMLADLREVGKTLLVDVFTHVNISSLLRPLPAVENSDAWAKFLGVFSVDFILCEPETSQVRLVVMQGEGNSELRKTQLDAVTKACEMADIPMLVVRDYNIAGLEKAILQKLTPPKKNRLGNKKGPEVTA